jgi:hypothetical protein
MNLQGDKKSIIENENRATSDLLKEEIKEEVKKMITFQNPNNFDEYFAKVLPKIGKKNF